MKTSELYNLWTAVDLFSSPTIDEPTNDIDELEFYDTQMEELNPDFDMDDWPEEDMNSLLYEMSTDPSPDYVFMN
jgi:hypothetical protein